MDGLTIRPLEPADAAGTLELLQPIVQESRYTILSELGDDDTQRKWIEGVLEEGVGTVASLERRIVGLQTIEPIASCPALRGVGDISTFVAEEYCGRGIGRLLAAHSILGAAGHFRKLVAMVRADNSRALAYYRAIGFAEVGRLGRHALVRDTPVDEILLEWHAPEVR